MTVVRSTGTTTRRPRSEWLALATRMRAQGMTGLAIARELGLSHQFVYELFRDPDGSKAKARKQGYASLCVDCGTPTSGGDGRRETPRCLSCASRHSAPGRTKWTREILVERMREWAALYGEPPAMPDWNPTKAREMGDEDRARRFEDDDRWPSFKSVVYHFGSWSVGLEAAGFTPRPAHGGGGNQWRRRDNRDAA